MKIVAEPISKLSYNNLHLPFLGKLIKLMAISISHHLHDTLMPFHKFINPLVLSTLSAKK